MLKVVAGNAQQREQVPERAQWLVYIYIDPYVSSRLTYSVHSAVDIVTIVKRGTRHGHGGADNQECSKLANFLLPFDWGLGKKIEN